MAAVAGVIVVAMLIVVLSHVLTYAANERSLFYRCCPKLPRLLFTSNRRLKQRPEQYWAFDVLDPDHLTTSYFVPVWVLAAWRLLTALYCAATILIERYATGSGLGRPSYVWISFFTDWSFVLLGFSGLLGFFVTVWRMTVRKRSVAVAPDVESGAPKQPAGTLPSAATASPQQTPGTDAALQMPQVLAPTQTEGHLSQPHHRHHGGGTGADELVSSHGALPAGRPARRWTLLEGFYLMVWETSAASALFVTVFYWAAVAGDDPVTADDIMKHGTNNVFVLGEVLLSRGPFISYHYEISLIYGTFYLIFMWAVWLPVKDYWVYSEFEWDHWSAAGAYILLPIAYFIAFVIWTIIAALREAVGRRYAIRRWSTASDTYRAPAAAAATAAWPTAGPSAAVEMPAVHQPAAATPTVPPGVGLPAQHGSQMPPASVI